MCVVRLGDEVGCFFGSCDQLPIDCKDGIAIVYQSQCGRGCLNSLNNNLKNSNLVNLNLSVPAT